MLERMAQRTDPPERKRVEDTEHSRRPRRKQSRPASPRRLHARQRSRQQRRDRRPRSRSRSFSVRTASGSSSPRRKGPVSFEDALRKRMARREAADSTRKPVAWTRDDMRKGAHRENRSKWTGPGQKFVEH